MAPGGALGLGRIRHVVVLMLENRSFDNLLGWLYDESGPPRGQPFDGLRPDMWNPLGPRWWPFPLRVPVRKNPARPGPAAGTYRLPRTAPGEGYPNTNAQLFRRRRVRDGLAPTNDGFVNNFVLANLFETFVHRARPSDPRSILSCYTPDQVPVISTLAREFGVCDRWFASVPSQTLPNRAFVHAATSCGHVENRPVRTCDAPTVFNRIEDLRRGGRTDLSWRVYSGTATRPGSLTRSAMTALHDPSMRGGFARSERFFSDAAAGLLPSYAFLEPPFGQDQHPPADVREAEQLVAQVYDAVADSPLWPRTLLVITYDEHGGCFDHVPPPAATPPDGRGPGHRGFRFDRFGVRVPAVVVSPFVEAGSVIRPRGPTPFDHTSIVATLRACFDLGAPLTARDRDAPDLGVALTLDEPRTDRPRVSPLPTTSTRRPRTRSTPLVRIATGLTAEATGTRRRPGENRLEYVSRAYVERFEP